MNPAYDLHIVDGSDSVWRPGTHTNLKWYTFHPNIRGGADASLAYCLSMMLNHEANYTHVGITEMDVLLDEGWFESTMELFGKGEADGLCVGAVSARSYVDRILIQRDGYGICHNLGAGNIIFTRAAAEIVLRTFRTGFWQDNVRLFAMLSGIDLRTYAAFRGNEQWTTTDWSWEAQLARHGLASLALTPAKCQMIGQIPPLAEQGLELTTEYGRTAGRLAQPFELYRDNLAKLRTGDYQLPQGLIHRDGAGMLFFPHQLPNLPGSMLTRNPDEYGNWKLKTSQGFGPFAYQARPGGAHLRVHVSGPVSLLATGGDGGAKLVVEDTRSGFKFSPDLPVSDQPIALQIPGGPITRLITAEFREGAVFYGLATADPQMLDTTFSFNWDQLPGAE